MLKNPQIFLQKQKKMSFFSLLEWYNRFDVNVQRCLFLGDIFVFIHHNAMTTLKALLRFWPKIFADLTPE